MNLHNIMFRILIVDYEYEMRESHAYGTRTQNVAQFCLYAQMSKLSHNKQSK